MKGQALADERMLFFQSQFARGVDGDSGPCSSVTLPTPPLSLVAAASRIL